MNKKRGRYKEESPKRIIKEPLEVVDEECSPVGILPRGEVHGKNLYHKSVHILIFNSKGQIYLQKRTLDRDENPGLWSSSASGHPKPGEPLIYSAQRELREELNLKVKLEEILRVNPCPETNWECVYLFVGKTDKPPNPNPSEILEGQFFPLSELETLLKEKPEIFSPSFRLLWSLYKKKIQTQKED